MTKKLLIIIFATSMFLVGCATPRDKIDAYSFLPGGSTYKHVYLQNQQHRDNQIAQYKREFDEAEYLPEENMIRVTANNKSAMVGVEVFSAMEALSKKGGIKALVADTVKTALYSWLAIEQFDDSGGGGGNRKDEDKRIALEAADGEEDIEVIVTGDNNKISNLVRTEGEESFKIQTVVAGDNNEVKNDVSSVEEEEEE